MQMVTTRGNWKLGLRRIGGLLTVALILISSLPVSGQEGGNGLQINNPRHEIQINPGEVKTFSVTVKNVTKVNLTAKMTLNDFESDGLTGNPKLIVDSDRRTSSSLVNFLKGYQEVTLAPDEQKQVTMTIDAPGDAPPGAYYGALRFTAVPLGSDGDLGDRQVVLTASVASLVLVEVSGDITRQIQLRSVKVVRDNKPGSFFTKPPTHLDVEVKNNGNSFSKPFGSVTINRGSKQVHSYELNGKDPRGNILPGSVRAFRDELKNVGTLGRYTATVNVSHGEGGEILTQQTSFWYIPMWIIIAALVLLLFLILGAYIFYRRKFAHRNKRHS